MQLALLKVLILMCGFCSRLQTISNLKVQRGSDMTLRCDVHLLSESSTLQWIKETNQTSNTTFLYNNSAYIILHNVDDHSEGIYYCKMIENGSVDTVINHTLIVTPSNLKVQRGSDVTLRCDVPLLSESSTLQWIKDTNQTSNTTLVYNKSAYIILHNVDDHSEGIYYCKMIENGSVDTVINHALIVTPSNLKVQRGSDVTLRCDVPLLSESSTLQWIKDRNQTSNTTLVYNNSAYIILHNVDDHSEGIYYCKMIENGSVDTVINHTLIVTPYSEGKKHSIYRQSSSHSDLLLIFKSKKKYQMLMWIWESNPHSKTKLIAVEKGGEVQVKGQIELGQKTSTTYNGQFFMLHISPVKFNYNGTYRCFPNGNTSPYTTTILHTIRVSAEPSGGVLRTQSVVLTCEVSDVSDSVTLVWLRMERNITVLVKQENLNETNNKILLTVNVSSLQSDLLDWHCAVFTENTLRAVASVSSISSTTDDAVLSKAGKISVVIVVTLFAGVLLGVLVYYWYRKQMPVSEESEAVYMNISRTMNDRAGKRNPRPEVHRQLTGQMNIVRRDETPVTSDSVTYASIYFNNSRLKTSPHINKRTG